MIGFIMFCVAFLCVLCGLFGVVVTCMAHWNTERERDEAVAKLEAIQKVLEGKE